MNNRARPIEVTVFSILLVLAGSGMLFLGSDAKGYLVPGACLLLQAVLLWKGASFKLFSGLLKLNQLTAIVLILVLWLGDTLHLPKLDVACVMLLANLATGGPLMGILAIPLLGLLHFSKALPGWFAPRTA